MDIKTLEILSIALYCAAGVFFAAAVALFFVFKVPALLGFITGRTAKRSVAEMKAKKNEHARSGSLTGAMSGSVEKTTEMTAQVTADSPVVQANASVSAATTVIGGNEEDRSQNTAATTVIENKPYEGTTVIEKAETEEVAEFKIIQEFNFTSSNEIIE